MKKLTLISLLFFTVTACNEAQFAGNASKATNNRNVPNVIDSDLSCSINPNTINVNADASIAILATADKGELIQTIIRGEDTQRFEMTFKDLSYVRKDGEENKVKATTEGKYLVNLAYADSETQIVASCDFDAKAETTTPPVNPEKPVVEPTCEDDEISVGADIAFLIDNSNSNAATDCQDPEKVGNFRNAGLYSCSGETNREKAVKSAFALMQKISEKEPDNSLALSRVSVASFPSKDNFEGGWTQESNGWLNTDTTNLDALVQSMNFTRTPFGLTPYGSAFAAGSELFAGSETERNKVAVLVTDGEPTDQDPESVAIQAQELRDQGVEVICDSDRSILDTPIQASQAYFCGYS